MKPKQESPIEVTLDKSPSGIWSAAPGSPRRTFQPWQRLWFVTGIVYLLMLAGSYYLLMPNQESIERRMVYSVTEELKRYDGMAFAGESPQMIFDSTRSQGYANWIAQVRTRYHIGNEGNAAFDRIESNYREAIADLPVKQKVGVLICIVVWLMPMGVLYAFGFIVDWIKRGVGGFKR
jgi:hypothetical protein